MTNEEVLRMKACAQYILEQCHKIETERARIDAPANSKKRKKKLPLKGDEVASILHRRNTFIKKNCNNGNQ